MKTVVVLSGLFLVAAQMKAQIATRALKDSIVKLKTITPAVNKKATTAPLTTEQEIDSQLNVIMNKYATKQNTATTWTMVKSDADALLLQYFIKGKLMGTKAAEAYFVKIGPATMTANDIANNKMILVCGIALIKPAEFITLRKEKVVAQ